MIPLLFWSQKHDSNIQISRDRKQDRHFSIVTEPSKYLFTKNSLKSSLWIKEYFVTLAPLNSYSKFSQ